jgi:hypothetical protein
LQGVNNKAEEQSNSRGYTDLSPDPKQRFVKENKDVETQT